MVVARSELRMSEAEVDAFLDAERVLRLASVDEDGWPHVAPLWFVWRDRRFWVHSLDRSKRSRLLRAGARSSVVVDGGESYGELRGVSCRVVPRFVDPDEDLTAVRRDFARRYLGTDEPVPPLRSHSWLELTPVDAIVSWDFRKLAGA